MNVNYQNKTWEVFGVRSAAQVTAEHPDKRIGKLMIENDLELLLLREIGFSTIDLKIARIHQPPQQTIVFRDKHQNVIDPDSFRL
ncbi:MAG: hypothetical protein RMX59_035135 [Nostoc sp. DedSLP05]|nr:hypothetical protein [Nostoc sp. DedSLP05]MDZ8102086.1 hypothetical protein [Nostoc sp. DedSLP01]